MADVELVLRYFAMRRLSDYNNGLKLYLDRILAEGSDYDQEKLELLRHVFEKAIQNAFSLFGQKAFCMFAFDKKKKRWGWSGPLKFIYDPVMLAVSDINIDEYSDDVKHNCSELEKMYRQYAVDFSGKTQSKSDIQKRTQYIKNVLQQLKK